MKINHYFSVNLHFLQCKDPHCHKDPIQSHQICLLGTSLCSVFHCSVKTIFFIQSNTKLLSISSSRVNEINQLVIFKLVFLRPTFVTFIHVTIK